MKKILKDLKYLSPVVHQMFSGFWGRVLVSFMVEKNSDPLASGQASGVHLQPRTGLLSLGMKNFQQEVVDFKKIKTQLIMKQIQEYLGKSESLTRFTVS